MLLQTHKIDLHKTDGLTLYLQVSFAAFSFCFKTNLSSIFLGDRCDGKTVAVATVYNFILNPCSDRYTFVKPSHTGIRWSDGALEYGVLPLHRSYVVEFGGDPNLSGCLKEKNNETLMGSRFVSLQITDYLLKRPWQKSCHFGIRSCILPHPL